MTQATKRSLHEATIDFAIAEAKSGRYGALANELKTRSVHPKIVAWVLAGCKTERKRGHPPIDPELEARIIDEYLRYREMIPRDELSEKCLLLVLAERHQVGQRALERMVARHRAASIAGIAVKAGVSEAEAEAWWNDKRERRWQRWREARRAAK